MTVTVGALGYTSHMELFLSHATADRELVDRIQTELRPQPVTVYAAEHDNQAGRNVHAKVAEALRRADLVVVLLSEAGFDSRYVQQEVGFALHAQKLVIPLVTKPVTKCDLGMLQGTEYIVIDPGDPAGAMQKLALRVADVQQREAARQQLALMAGVALIVLGVVLLANAE